MARTLTIECLQPGNGAYLVSNRYDARRAEGFPGAGPADQISAALGNRLLGQAEDTTCLELTLTGGRWRLSGTGQFALTGAEMGAKLDDRVCATDEVHDFDADDQTLTLGPAQNGMRTYLTVRGEWMTTGTVPNRPLAKGWRASVHGEQASGYQLSLDKPFWRNKTTLTALPGPEWELLPAAAQRWLLSGTFRLTGGNRQGLRLEAPTPVPPLNLGSMLSSPVLPGTVQWTPAGLVVLGPAAQTVGGYPRVLLLGAELLSPCYQMTENSEIRFNL